MEPKHLLEPEYAPAFTAWQANPSPTTTGALLRTVKPSLDKAISAHIGAGDPIVNGQAKKIALGAFKTYDPTKARLGTHLMNQLQSLKRITRRQTQVLGVPERISLAYNQMTGATAELEERLGREPTDNEIADHMGLSLSRLRQVRRSPAPMSEGYFSEAGEDDEGGFNPEVLSSPSRAYLNLVYSDLDPVNQKIMEWTLGMNGRRPISNQAIAAKLRISPGAVSQRKASIQRMIETQQSSGIF